MDGQQILVLWVPGGSNRPCEVPEQITASQVPFDGCPNTQTSLEDVSMVLVQDHLRKVGSSLQEWIEQHSKITVLEQVLLVENPVEHRVHRRSARSPAGAGGVPVYGQAARKGM